MSSESNEESSRPDTSRAHNQIVTASSGAGALAAIRAGDAEALAQALLEHPGLATSGLYGPPLMEAASELGHAPCISALLAAGMLPDSADELGYTPLMAAAWGGHLEAARTLLGAGADPNAVAEEDGSYGDPDDSGQCALYCALFKGHRALVDLLEPLTNPELRRRAYETAEQRRLYDDSDVDVESLSDATIRLIMAAQQGRLDLLREAITQGADINGMLEPGASNPRFGSTPLSFAAGQGRADLVKALLAAGADPVLADHSGDTAADIAERNGHSGLAEMLRTAPRAFETDTD